MTAILLALAAKGIAAAFVTFAMASLITLVAITAVSMAYPAETAQKDSPQGYTVQGLLELLAEDEK